MSGEFDGFPVRVPRLGPNARDIRGQDLRAGDVILRDGGRCTVTEITDVNPYGPYNTRRHIVKYRREDGTIGVRTFLAGSKLRAEPGIRLQAEDLL